jgi:hypothetical protein
MFKARIKKNSDVVGQFIKFPLNGIRCLFQDIVSNYFNKVISV